MTKSYWIALPVVTSGTATYLKTKEGLGSYSIAFSCGDDAQIGALGCKWLQLLPLQQPALQAPCQVSGLDSPDALFNQHMQ